ncbi:hypothetical protein BV20DRAFT_990959 [Pilatotrama ljubarskyi]|nr:hypothetical protein BV20DRAFT_990959 [Pilatotrama ljubarskyi]
MSRIPPALLYLTIYNPTLKPVQLDPYDEDAEELAHILFYTAREHAVSRDRILRQVGLAKALVNFSEMFNAAAPCENVHSQARRMIMLSPEPNFWIHACYEVAKTPRPPPSASKSKDSAKSKSKGKEKEKDQTSRPRVVYDYHDGSVHDEALRTHFRRGYEEFKLVHGSFTSVLSTHGQQALELQLERFFTVWAWKWDIEDEDFGTHLGVPLHPLHDKLTPLLDSFTSKLPQELVIFALIPPYVIPPRTPRYPAALVRHVLSRIPPPQPPVSPRDSARPSAPSSAPMASNNASNPTPPGGVKQDSGGGNSTLVANLLSVPTVPSMNLGLDMKSLKWNWPGYLTFGKSAPSSQASSVPQTPPAAAVVTAESARTQSSVTGVAAEDGLKQDSGHSGRKETLDVDRASLLEAISTESIGSHTRPASPAPSALSKSSHLGEAITQGAADDSSPVASGISPVQGNGETAGGVEAAAGSSPTPPPVTTAEAIPRAAPQFLRSPIHIAHPEDPLATERKRLLHLTHDQCTVAFVLDIDHMLELERLSGDTVELIESMLQIVREEMSQNEEQQIPSATKILQPKDKYIVVTDEYTTTPPAGFTSRSEHLYNGQQLLRSDHDVLEVFSRGQNPQHWHIGKRGLGTAADGRVVDGEAYMEVSRKETTLTDVDNELAGVVRRFIERLQ